MTLLLCLLAVFYLSLRLWGFEDRKPIFGVYHQRTRWYPFKYALYLVVFHAVKLARRVRGLRREALTRVAADLDRPLPLVPDIKAFDGVLFTGGNRQGYFFVMAAERCHKNVVNGYFYLLVPKTGLLCSLKLPDTLLFDGVGDRFGAEGVLITQTIPMKRWKLRYRGVMWLSSNPQVRFRVRFTAQWSSSYVAFNCTEDCHTPSLARSIATQAWTSEFFENMRCRRWTDVEYYQMGSTKVECTVGPEVHDFYSLSFRSHQNGTRRDLLTQHRSAFFHIFLDNGVMAVIGVTCNRSRITSLEVGYVQKPDGGAHPVEWCDFQLYQHGECGRPPTDHGFQFKAGDVIYAVRLKVLREHVHFIGWNWEAKAFVRFVRCVVNGVLGQGISEFQYRNRRGRPTVYNEADPPWFQVFRPHYVYS